VLTNKVQIKWTEATFELCVNLASLFERKIDDTREVLGPSAAWL